MMREKLSRKGRAQDENRRPAGLQRERRTSEPSTAAAAIPAFFFGTRHVHSQWPAFQLGAVQCLDRRFGLSLLGHLDKPEALGLTAEPIINYGSKSDLNKKKKTLAQIYLL